MRRQQVASEPWAVTSGEAPLPNRVCGELFPIHREALENVKKHARASRVVVKVWQDGGKVSLLVEDNGRAFNSAGRFEGPDLDRLRLGLVSIKERTLSVGSTLMVESHPGRGSRLRVGFPVS